MRLSGQRVLITGGSDGIGLAIARRLAPSNQLVIVGRNQERLDRAARDLGAHCIVADLARPESARQITDEAVSHMGGVSVLVNNAAVQHNVDWLKESSASVAERASTEIATNFTSLVTLTALLLPTLIQADSAAIVNVSSGLAYAPKKQAPIYCATKAAVGTFSRALRYQLEDSTPHVGLTEVVLPLVDTAMTAGRDGFKKLTADEAAAQIVEAIERGADTAWVGKTKALRVLLRISRRRAYALLRDQ